MEQPNIVSATPDYLVGVDKGHPVRVPSGGPIVVSASRELSASDNGQVIECTTSVTLSISKKMPPLFSCAVIASGTTTIASLDGVLLNGATSSVARAASGNLMFAIQARASVGHSYIVTGV